MAKISISIGKKKKKKKKKKSVVPSKVKKQGADPTVIAAEEAVAQYEEQHQILHQMRAEFEENYADAYAFLDQVKRQEDSVQEAIESAKLKVRTAKITVRDFVCQRKWSQAAYNGKMMSNIISGLDNAGEIVEELLNKGVIESIGLSKSALSFIAGRPEYSELFMPAFEDKKEKTPAVTTPKI